MPRIRRQKKLSIPGVLGRELHLYHQHWQFTFIQPHADADSKHEEYLDNDDLEMCSRKNQIKIFRHSVLMYVGERTTSVTADLHLPPQVTMVIIPKFGQDSMFCYASVAGQPNCMVKPGSELKKNPQKKRFQ